jgi:hypothetical protein
MYISSHPVNESTSEEVPFELLNAVDTILKAAGYTLSSTPEDVYVFDMVKKAIRENGISRYTNSRDLLESTLPDNTDREELLDLLRYMVRNIQAKDEILLIDPYLFPRNPDPDFLPHLIRVFETAIGQINTLRIVTKQNHNAGLLNEFLTAVVAIKPGIVCSTKFTDIFHDRFWIADQKLGVIIGTSFNGIGRRFSLADYLREEDVTEIYARFQQIP